MLHMSMVLRVLCYLESGLVIDVENRRRVEVVAKGSEQVAKKEDLLASSGGSNVLCLRGGESNKGLKARLPGDCTSAYLHDVARGRAAVVWIPCMVRVGVGVEELSEGRRSVRVSEFVVQRALEIAKEVLDSLPMLEAWVLTEASKDSNTVGDVWTCGNRLIGQGSDSVDIRDGVHLQLFFIRLGSHRSRKANGGIKGSGNRTAIGEVEVIKEV